MKDWENRKELGHNHWWDMYVDNLETADLEEICHQVLDLYIQQPTPAKDAADSPPQPGTPGSAPNSSLSQGSRQSSAQNSENKVRYLSSFMDSADIKAVDINLCKISYYKDPFIIS